MKKHILIALALIASMALPLAVASRSSKKTPAPKTLMAAVTAEVADAKELSAPSPGDQAAPTKAPSTAPAGKPGPKSIASKKVTDAPKTAKVPAKVPAKQSRARQAVADLTMTQKTKLLTFLNEASVKDLANVQGISTTRGAAIEGARPFEGIDELILVKGIGEGTFAEIVKHGKTLTLARSASTDDKKASLARKSS